ncbi:unnamed protein product [Allacma fusca]|uniref:Peroxidase n=1 Tax=Allacma fusca TaxID=39272 RepID=A0A8J2PWI9_9HEXA|nr:unnamed protein product [Allacma fusca]
MSRAGRDLSDYAPIGGVDDGLSGTGTGNPVIHFINKHGQKLWWTIVGVATIVALALLIHAYGRASVATPAVTGVRTKDAESLYKQTFPIPDVAARQVQESQAIINNGGNRPVLKSSSSVRAVDAETVQEALRQAQAADVKRLSTEENMKKNGYVSNRYSPAGRHQSFMSSSPRAQKISEDGFKMDQASKYIARKLKMPKADAGQIRVDIPEDGTCIPPLNITTCVALNSATNVYHSSDGLCNNINNPGWGAYNQPYRRVIAPDYADGISSPRVSQDGLPLPHPRKISTLIHTDKPTEDSTASLLLPIFGQFIDHDVTSTVLGVGTSSRVLNCCKNGKIAPPSEIHPECFPFDAENNEIAGQDGEKCTNLWRSARYPSCDFGARNQFSQTTSYIDASVIYGSTDDAIRSFREVNIDNPHGYMATATADDGRKLLPVSTDLLDGCNIPSETEKGQFCFTSGDPRVNEQMALTSMHLLWTRQHNMIADVLRQLNPEGHDGKVYFETREIIIAQLQHVTYNEFLPVLLGRELADAAGLIPLKEGYYTEYDDTVDASISNVFVSAAYRVGHSMMKGLVKLVDEKGNVMESVSLHELLYDPFRLWKAGTFDGILRGHTSAPAGRVDTHFTTELTHHLFENRNGSTAGLDLAAINIQRGRDHGIPSYTAWREACGLDPVADFSDLAGLWNEDTLFIAQNVYRNVSDVDLYTGMLSEKKVPGAMVGPTLACLLADQFVRLRKGDRFWYESNVQRGRPIPPEQLQIIRKTTLARIICDNSDGIKEIQARPLEQPSIDNPILPCDSIKIPTLDYTAWESNVKEGLLPHKN